MEGRMVSVAKVEKIKSADHCAAEWSGLRSAFAKPIAMGIIPKIIAAAVIRMARRRPLAPVRAASRSGRPSRENAPRI